MINLKIASRNFPVTEAMQSAIEKHTEKLEEFYDRIERCEVVISSPHHHRNKGRIYHVKVKLSVPGSDVFINREAEKDSNHEDFYVALRDAFQAAERRLRDHVLKLRGFVKDHRSENLDGN